MTIHSWSERRQAHGALGVIHTDRRSHHPNGARSRQVYFGYFGVARTPRQRSLYNTLDPLLASVRDEGRAPVAASKPAPGSVRRTNLGKADLPSRSSKNQVVFNLRAGRPQ